MNYSQKITSPIGALYLVANDHALISLNNTIHDLYIKAMLSTTHPILNMAGLQLAEYFSENRTSFSVPLELHGTPFQQKAWEALRLIPFGTVWSYGEQAKFLQSPKASRAIGSANGKNPILIIVPCHRVISATKKLTGYSGGLPMKMALLKHEGITLRR